MTGGECIERMTAPTFKVNDREPSKLSVRFASKQDAQLFVQLWCHGPPPAYVKATIELPKNTVVFGADLNQRGGF